MVFDVERHEESKWKFLQCLYEIASEHIAASEGNGDPTLVMESEQEVGRRAGLSPKETDRIGSELSRYGYLDGCGGGDGPDVSLTQKGLEAIEQHLYENSALGKRRRLKKWFITKAKELAEIGAGKLLTGLGGFLLAALAIYRADAVAWALKHVFAK